MRWLQEVCASENRIQCIDGVFCRHASLQRLQLSANRICSLRPLPWLPQLQALDLADNPLTHLPPLTQQPLLRALNISFCSLPQGTVCPALKPLTSLKELQVLDTIAAEHTRSGRTSLDTLLRTMPWLLEVDHVQLSPQQQAAAALQALVASPCTVQQVRRRLMSGSAELESSCRLAVDAAGGVALQGGQDALLGALPMVLRLAQPVAGAPCGSLRGCARGDPADEQHACALLRLHLHQHTEALASRRWECTHLANELCSAAAANEVLSMQKLCEARAQLQQACVDMHVSLQTFPPRYQHGILQVNSTCLARRVAGRQTAAAVLQKAWRANRGRVAVSVARRHAAALLIQAWVRGRRVRQGGLLTKLRLHAAGVRQTAAVVVQKVWRGFRVRRLMTAARAAVRECGRASRSSASCCDQDDLTCDSLNWELPALGEDILQELVALEPDEGLPAVKRAGQHMGSWPCDQDQPDTHAPAADSGFYVLPPLNPAHVSVDLGSTGNLATGEQVGWQNSEHALADMGQIRQKLGPGSALLRKYELQQQKRSGPQSPSLPHVVHAEEVPCAPQRNGSPTLYDAYITLQQSSTQPSSGVGHVIGNVNDVPSPAGLHNAAGHSGDAAREHHRIKVQQLQAEWGFQDEGTAAAFLQSRRHAQRGHTKRKQLRRLQDPTARLRVHMAASPCCLSCSYHAAGC